MGGGGKIGDPKDMAIGSVLQCAEAATLGMPFEVWKTRYIQSGLLYTSGHGSQKNSMGRFRNEGSVEALVNVYKRSGFLFSSQTTWPGLNMGVLIGIGGYWQGTSAKMVESALKGGILLYAKEAILVGCV